MPLEHGLGVTEGRRLVECRSYVSVDPWFDRPGGLSPAEWK
jgi:hypothetical protein